MKERLCTVYTLRYEADLGKLLGRRLRAQGMELAGQGAGRAWAQVGTPAQAEGWVSAVGALIMRDLACLELAARVEALPLALREKELILPEAIKLARAAERTAICCALYDWFFEHDELNLEGFVDFRAPQLRRAWDVSVREAAEELLLEREYSELVGVLSAFVQLQPARIPNVYIILNPDGSCTLTDDMQTRIDYGDCTGDGVVSALIGLAPERITVYDLSEGRSAMLADVLMRIFEDRVKYFR